MPNPYKLYLQNDNVLTCEVAFKDTGAASTEASVSADVWPRNGSSSAGALVESSLTMQQNNTDGKYERLLDETQYTENVWYTAGVVVATSDGTDGYVELDFKVMKRRVT